jgi:hypothetical protein
MEAAAALTAWLLSLPASAGGLEDGTPRSEAAGLLQFADGVIIARVAAVA